MIRWVVYLVLVGGTLVLCGLYYLYNVTEREAMLDKSEAAMVQKEATRNALAEEVARMEAVVNGLDSNPLEVEAAIRRNKRLLREGEVVYRIKPLPEDETGHAAPGADQSSARAVDADSEDQDNED
ncbi:MAG: hypothetical protein ACLFTT_06355 [Candidatus Hydrogenedentota bacterium]